MKSLKLSSTKSFLKNICAFSLLSSLVLHPTLVGANEGYEEVSYEQLLNELNSKTQVFESYQPNSFDDVRLHAGVGYANSFMNVASSQGDLNEHSTGIQLSLGMDLFSPHWYSEGVFKNFGVKSSDSKEISLRELDLKVGYTNQLSGPWSYSLSTGLSNRFLKFKDKSTGLNVDETTPSFVVSSGIAANIHTHLKLGAELSAHSALISDTMDKHSVDLSFRLTTSL